MFASTPQSFAVHFIDKLMIDVCQCISSAIQREKPIKIRDFDFDDRVKY